MKRQVLVLVAVLLAAQSALADRYGSTFEVTITNITSGQTFTPLLVVSHSRRVNLFELGEPAINELAIVAEAGDVGPLAAFLSGLRGKVLATADSGGLLGPGDSVTVEVPAGGRFDRISVVGMLIPTNDTFVALDSARIYFGERDYLAVAYDSGSEYNDELCARIPGPPCFGEGYTDADGEGYVHISRGIAGIGDLEPSNYDWRNPVAEITIRPKR